MTKFAYFCGHEQWHPEQLVEHARIAEDAGFDMVVVSEHFHPWVDDASASGFAFSTIGAMAAATEHIEFATGVTTPLFRYHPGVVAQAAATLDRLSAGRFTLGVGTGENINEGPLGYSFPGYAERNARMTESLEIMRRLLDGEKLTYEGEYYRTDRAKLYSPPLGPVPILLAAGGPKSADLAGGLAQGVVTSVKDPAETMENVVTPGPRSRPSAGRPDPVDPGHTMVGHRRGRGRGLEGPLLLARAAGPRAGSRQWIPPTSGSVPTPSPVRRSSAATRWSQLRTRSSTSTGRWSRILAPTSSRSRWHRSTSRT